MVLQGQWTEDESVNRIQADLQQYQQTMPTEHECIKEERDLLETIDFLKKIRNPKEVFEKEYYFDEGLGQTLQEHVDSIKANFPNIQTLVRRDRDGYAIVKTVFKPKYRFDLNEIEKFDPVQ